MAIKLIAFDLDSTLLDSEKNISGENLSALKAAAERGILTVPASGRLYSGMPEALRGPNFRYYVLGNGLMVYDVKEDRRLCEYVIPLNEAMELIRNAERIGCLYDCYSQDRAYMSRTFFDNLENLFHNPTFLKMMHELRNPVDDLKQLLQERNQPVQKVMYYFPHVPDRDVEIQRLREMYPQYNISSSVYCNIEINEGRADKGSALLALGKELGIAPEEMMVLGDASNDLGMFRIGAFNVAMGNAEPGIKELADFVTLDCDHSGVAHAIRKYAL